MAKEEDMLDNIDIEEKLSAASSNTMRLATRKFIEESCELSKILPAHKRILFVMHYSHGFSISEIADLCKVGTGTVTKRLKEIANELNAIRNCMKVKDDGKTNQSTKERIESYFRREKQRRNSLRTSENIEQDV